MEALVVGFKKSVSTMKMDFSDLDLTVTDLKLYIFRFSSGCCPLPVSKEIMTNRP